jgi:hypothetical protein
MAVSRPNRLEVSLKVKVSGVDANGVPFDIAVDSTNVSRGGLAFHADLAITAGAQLQIVVQRPPIGGREFPPFFTQGRVVRVAPSVDGRGSVVAVEFTGPRLRMFSGEGG